MCSSGVAETSYLSLMNIDIAESNFTLQTSSLPAYITISVHLKLFGVDFVFALYTSSFRAYVGTVSLLSSQADALGDAEIPPLPFRPMTVIITITIAQAPAQAQAQAQADETSPPPPPSLVVTGANAGWYRCIVQRSESVLCVAAPRDQKEHYVSTSECPIRSTLAPFLGSSRCSMEQKQFPAPTPCSMNTFKLETCFSCLHLLLLSLVP